MLQRKLQNVFMLNVFVGLLLMVSISLAQSGTWTPKANIPTARFMASSCELNGKIYVIGGCKTLSSSLNTMEVYDPVTDTWDATKEDMLTARVELCVAVVNGKIYAIGGSPFHNGGTALGMVEEYDPLNDSWITKSPMPTARKGAACGVINNKIYVAGGSSSASGYAASNKLEVYDPATDTWTTLAIMLAARYAPMGAVLNDTLYVSGGLLGYSPWTGQTAVQRYDTISGSWSYGTPLNYGRVGHTTDVIDGKIYAIAGTTQPPDLENVEEYDPQTETWAVTDTTPSAMVAHTSSVYSNEIYIFSGYFGPMNNLTLTDNVYSYNVIGVAHAYSVKCFPNYITPQGDTLVINAWLSNPENHPLEVHAIIYDEQYALVDSVQLYDDGLHNDSLASDNIWGNSKWLSGLMEDIYLIEISVYDIADDNLQKLYPLPAFTTIGPVDFESFSVTGDTLIDPSDYKKFKFTLLNAGSTATATNVTSQVVCLDTFASINILVTSEYGDIAAGVSSFSNDGQYIRFSDSCTAGQQIPLALNIFSNGYKFWCGTFIVNINPSGLEKSDQNLPLRFALNQNYPNPFNPITNIEFSIPKTEFVTLKIYNLLGQEVVTLVSEKLRAGKYQYSWEAGSLASGVYLYRLQAGDPSTGQGIVETKKMILLQ